MMQNSDHLNRDIKKSAIYSAAFIFVIFLLFIVNYRFGFTQKMIETAVRFVYGN